MRVKDLWEIVPLPAKIKLFWDRITLTRTTTVYFVFSVLHCVVQVILQAQAFHINVQAADFLSSIIKRGNAVESHAFYVFGNDLRLCDHVSQAFNTDSCQVIWEGMLGKNTLTPLSTTAALSLNATTNSSSATSTNDNSSTSMPNAQPYLFASFPPGSNSTPTATEDAENRTQYKRVYSESAVVVNGVGWNNESAAFDTDCLWSLGWPVQVLRNTQREDLTFIMFQIWVLGISIVAILNESVPHTIATLLTHLVVTGWAGFQIFSTVQFRGDFAKVTTDGACQPINLLPTYWQSRSAAEMTSLVLNAAALLISAFLSWKLAKSFGWQTYKRVGASLIIGRIYKIVLIFSIAIQLSVFFIVTSIALWLDQLWNGAIGRLATSPLYRPFLIVTLILLPIWLAFGWYSVRQERKMEMLIFLSFCLGYLAGWGAMFDSVTFRWTYITWGFFGVMTTTSVFLTLLAFILGIICRCNFGRGLPHYLKAQEPIEDGFVPITAGDPEKVDLPASKEPTFSVALGSGIQIPSVPRMSARNAVQPMRMVSQKSLRQPSPAIIRAPSERTYSPLYRARS